LERDKTVKILDLSLSEDEKAKRTKMNRLVRIAGSIFGEFAEISVEEDKILISHICAGYINVDTTQNMMNVQKRDYLSTAIDLARLCEKETRKEFIIQKDYLD